jgi:hypothetical protein
VGSREGQRRDSTVQGLTGSLLFRGSEGERGVERGRGRGRGRGRERERGRWSEDGRKGERPHALVHPWRASHLSAPDQHAKRSKHKMKRTINTK